MDPALRLGGRDPLDPMHTGLAAEPPEGVLPPHRKDDFPHAAQGGATLRDQLDPQPVPLAISRVHPVEIGGEQGRFVAAGAGTDFDDRVAVIERIARQQQII